MRSFRIMELPYIITGGLVLLVMIWEMGWKGQLSDWEEWRLVQQSRHILAGLVWGNTLILLARLVAQFRAGGNFSRFVWIRLGFGLLLSTLLAIEVGHPNVPEMLAGTVSVLCFVLGLMSFYGLKIYLAEMRVHEVKVGLAIWSPTSMFLTSLLTFILLGALFLLTPGATYGSISLVDALFVSTSATTVTGLMPVSANETFTPFGKCVLLVLMQVGALGVMTFNFFIALMVGRGLTVRERVTFSALLDETPVSGVGKLVVTIIVLSLVLEFFGAVGLYFAWMDSPAIPEGSLWAWSIFHAVSGFCNAGISLFPDSLASEGIHECYTGLGLMAFLMCCGSFGFAIYLETIHRVKLYWQGGKRALPLRWTTHTWLVLRMMLVMLVVGGITLGLLGEFEPGSGAQDEPFGWAFIEGIYNAVAARTSGFNMSIVSNYGPVYLLFLCVLMFIGGNPGSTSGGVLTTTVALVYMEVRRIILGRADVEFNSRRIARGNVERAMATIVIAVAWIVLVTLIMLLVEDACNPQPFGLQRIFFEVVSAFATCGFSLEVTPHLSTLGKYIILLNMIIGRVGMLSFVLVLTRNKAKRLYIRYPETRLPLT